MTNFMSLPIRLNIYFNQQGSKKRFYIAHGFDGFKVIFILIQKL